MISMSKYVTTEVQLCRFICYGCQLYISIPWGDILDLCESCPESCAGRIFAQINIPLNGIWLETVRVRINAIRFIFFEADIESFEIRITV